jgi:NAD+ kinase
VFAVYYRPDLRPLAEEFKSRYGAVDLTCRGELSHVFILGGDGTLLEALRRFPCVLDSVVVHLGMGRVNFYRSAEFTIPVEEAVAKIRRGEYRVLEFSTLEHDGCRALNEISIYREGAGEASKLQDEDRRGGGGGEGRRGDHLHAARQLWLRRVYLRPCGGLQSRRGGHILHSALYAVSSGLIVLVSSQVVVETARGRHLGVRREGDAPGQELPGEERGRRSLSWPCSASFSSSTG